MPTKKTDHDLDFTELRDFSFLPKEPAFSSLSLEKSRQKILSQTVGESRFSPYTWAAQILLCTLAGYGVLGGTPIAMLEPTEIGRTLEGLAGFTSIAGLVIAYLGLMFLALSIMRSEGASDEASSSI